MDERGQVHRVARESGAVTDWERYRWCRNRELKMETFSGRRRPDWQRKPGTKAAVAPVKNRTLRSQ